MAEEHRFQAPRLCANNCGFFGSAATQDLCSKCYRDLQLKEQQSSSAKQAFNQAIAPICSSSASSSVLVVPEIDLVTGGARSEESAVQANPNRCLTCRKRVGITGFKCRCGMVFCGIHRYPEQHGCSFDFKGMEKEQIAKANPVVKASKLEKI